ncbi:MAG: phenylalanine 4-monooxygenase [Allosphingosinicella sp.]|uniref:phenylalanine 4-monooxygenase n=1 Tax=Allosphingosinicella sp. TaxID=2823234 RepID=UPI003931C5B3
MFTEFEAPPAAGATLPPHVHLVRPAGTVEDWTMPQHWERFTAEEHRVWDLLFARQQERLAGRVVRAFAEGLDVLHLSRPGIPELGELNERLHARTAWQVVAVPGLLPDDIFFAHLATRRFPAGNFIRRADQLDYLEEPDVFHDVFGHVPMLANPAVADFMQKLGEAGLAALASGNIHRLSRLYWYTVEFGLAREDGELKIYGAGLASSFEEAGYALESPLPRRRPFEFERVLRTRYRSDSLQQAYFIVDSFDDLLAQIEGADLEALYDGLAEQPDLLPSA